MSATSSPAAEAAGSSDTTGSSGAGSGSAGFSGAATSDTGSAPRLAVAKTYKLYVGGAFPRSESGRSYPVLDARGGFLANAAQGSRKDARDAVTAARKAFAGWSGATAYNRGQVLYRVAEVMEGRRGQFIDEVIAAEGLSPESAVKIVDAAIDRWVWYAGWTDKLAQVAGAANPVAGPYFNLSVPEPTGVVAVLAPQASSLLGLISVIAPVIVPGNTCVVLASPSRPLPAVTLGEVLATSDLPGGVVNILTGRTAEIAPWLASHEDVDGLDLTGATTPPARPTGGTVGQSGKASESGQLGEPGGSSDDGVDWAELEAAAAASLTRVLRPAAPRRSPEPAAGRLHGSAEPSDGSAHGSAEPSGPDPRGSVEPDWTRPPAGPRRILAFCETKTVWHPKGR